MSYADAIGEIDQILQLQQQLLDPQATTAAATTGATTTTTTGATTTATSGSTSTFASELEQALATSEGSTSTGTTATAGIDTGTTDLSATDTSATDSSTASGSVQAMLAKASSLVGDPYVWGGGHDGWSTQSGYDCSGFVSAVLHAGGYLSSPQDTETLPEAAGIESGAGQHVTIYDRDESGEEGHVIIEIDGQFFESGGEHSSWGGGGGVEQIARPSAAYLSTFNDVLHPAGL
jgi:cell wall-associated NlpC family hydrolase